MDPNDRVDLDEICREFGPLDAIALDEILRLQPRRADLAEARAQLDLDFGDQPGRPMSPIARDIVRIVVDATSREQLEDEDEEIDAETPMEG